MTLRPYQSTAADGIMREFESNQSTIAVMPTGTGKTVLFAEIIKRFQPRRCMVLAHREELINQAVDKIQNTTGIRCDVEMADRVAMGNLFESRAQVIVSTIQTQIAGSNGGRMTRFDPNEFGLVIIDECHRSVSDSYKKTIAYYGKNPSLKLLGVTATPDRADEIAMGEVFNSVAFDYEILDAINDGYLVPIRQKMVHVDSIDLSEVRTTAGDFNRGDLARVMEDERSLHEVASSSLDMIGTRRALLFAASVEQAKHLSDVFNRHRPEMSDWVCGETDKESRRNILRKFADGTRQVVCNYGVLTEGYDNPAIEVVIMARPTKSRSLYGQMVGRGTRPLPGVIDREGQDAEARKSAILQSAKPHLLVVDFSGNSGRHQLITTADILGGKCSDEVVKKAKARALGQEVDMAAWLGEIESEMERERKKAVIAKARYRTQDIDPFDVYGIKRERERGWHAGKQLSLAQFAAAQKFGLPIERLKYCEQRQLLDEAFKRIKAGLCSFKQMRVLTRFGYDAKSMSFDQARATMDELARNGWKRTEVAA